MKNPEIDSRGNKFWYNERHQLHRDGDLPAAENITGSKYWYVNGVLHRDGDLPAIEWENGSKYWYVNGVLHRDNGLPACEYSYGNKHWHDENGQCYRWDEWIYFWL